MSPPDARNARPVPRAEDPNRWIYVSGLAAGAIFTLGFLAALIASIATGDVSLSGIVVTVVVAAAASLGFVGWRHQRVAYSWGAMLLVVGGMALSQALTS